MAHRGGQGGEFGLDVGAGVVPTQQDTQGVCVAKIVDARHTPGSAAQTRALKELAQAVSKSCS
jgi:hypothetical protein